MLIANHSRSGSYPSSQILTAGRPAIRSDASMTIVTGCNYLLTLSSANARLLVLPCSTHGAGLASRRQDVTGFTFVKWAVKRRADTSGISPSFRFSWHFGAIVRCCLRASGWEYLGFGSDDIWMKGAGFASEVTGNIQSLQWCCGLRIAR